MGLLKLENELVRLGVVCGSVGEATELLKAENRALLVGVKPAEIVRKMHHMESGVRSQPMKLLWEVEK